MDNVPEAAAAYTPDLGTLSDWDILLTSRDAIQNTDIFELDVLAPDEAAAVFERICHSDGVTSSHPVTHPGTDPALAEILRDIGYHTLTIELLAAYAREKRLDPAALLAELRQRDLARLDDYEVSVARSHKMQGLNAHLRDVFLLDLSEAEKDIMRNCAILPPAGTVMDAALMSDDQLCTLMGKQDEAVAFKNTLHRLARLHWLEAKKGGYWCHPVIAETAKLQLLPDAENCAVLIKNVTRLLVPDSEANEPRIKRLPYAPLGVAVLKGVWKVDGVFVEADKAVAWLAVWLDNVFRAAGELYKALAYIQKGLAIQEKALPLEHPDLATSYNNLAVTYHALGDLDKAIAFMRQAVGILDKSLPANHPNTQKTKKSLAIFEEERARKG